MTSKTTRAGFLTSVLRYSDQPSSWIAFTGEEGAAVRLEGSGLLRVRLPGGRELAASLDHLSICGEGVPIVGDVPELRQVRARMHLEDTLRFLQQPTYDEETRRNVPPPPSINPRKCVPDGGPIAPTIDECLRDIGVRDLGYRETITAADLALALESTDRARPGKQLLIAGAPVSVIAPADCIVATGEGEGWRPEMPGDLSINADDGGRLDDMVLTATGGLVPEAMAGQYDEIVAAGVDIDDPVRAAQAERDKALEHLAAMHTRAQATRRLLEWARRHLTGTIPPSSLPMRETDMRKLIAAIDEQTGYSVDPAVGVDEQIGGAT
jgi:hypothetical protein